MTNPTNNRKHSHYSDATGKDDHGKTHGLGIKNFMPIPFDEKNFFQEKSF